MKGWYLALSASSAQETARGADIFFRAIAVRGKHAVYKPALGRKYVGSLGTLN